MVGEGKKRGDLTYLPELAAAAHRQRREGSSGDGGGGGAGREGEKERCGVVETGRKKNVVHVVARLCG